MGCLAMAFSIARLCSPNLSLRWRLVSPIYWTLHLLHCIDHIHEIGKRAGDVMSYASLRHLIQPYRIYLKSFPATFILRSSQRCLEAFPSPPRISYRRCKNLRDILIRAKHRRQALPPASGAFRCHRNRCKTCPFIAEGTISYTFFSINEQRRIRHHITCSRCKFFLKVRASREPEFHSVGNNFHELLVFTCK